MIRRDGTQLTQQTQKTDSTTVSKVAIGYYGIGATGDNYATMYFQEMIVFLDDQWNKMNDIENDQIGYWKDKDKNQYVSDTCTTNVLIKDTIPPTAVCTNFDTVLFLDANSMVTLDSNALDNSTDNCGIDSIWLSRDTFNCSDAGNTVVVYNYVRDSSGNVDSCRDSVVILDTIPPTATCKYTDLSVYLDSSGMVTLDSNALDSSSDSCGIAGIWLSQNTFSCMDTSSSGIMVYSYIIDSSGNIDSCMTTITVTDTISPYVSAPSDTAIVLTAGTNKIYVGGLAPDSVWDNCGISDTTNDHNQSVNASDTFNQASTMVTYTVEDFAGNQATDDFTVTLLAYPMAVDDGIFELSGAVNSVLSENVYSNDSHTFYSNTQLSYSLVDEGTLGNVGTIDFNEDGTFSFTRTSTDTGNYTFTYQVCDTISDLTSVNVSSLCDTAMVMVKLGGLPPEYQDEDKKNEPIATVDGEVKKPIQDHINFNGNIESVTIVSVPTNGTFTIDTSSGTFTYRVNTNYIGLDSVVMEACNDHGLCDTFVLYFESRCADDLRNIELSIPNILTPNNDGNNDEWVIQELYDLASCYTLNEVIVFNHWGVKVFHKKDFGRDNIWWDVTSDGNVQKGADLLPSGTYYYIILMIGGDREKAYTGFIHIQY